MKRRLDCSRCGQPYQPIVKPNSIIHSVGTALRGFCKPCEAKNEAEWRARKAAK